MEEMETNRKSRLFFCLLLAHLWVPYWKRLWCWEALGAGGEGDDRGWDGWMASLTQWTRVWVNSGSWWWTGRPGVLQFMGSQRDRHDWVTELNWTELWGYGTADWFQIGKGVCQGCIFVTLLIYLIYRVHHAKCPGWMKHKLESRLPGEISIT